MEKQKELISKLLAASNAIEESRVGKGDYITMTINQIDKIAIDMGVSREEVISMIDNYFKPNNEKK